MTPTTKTVPSMVFVVDDDPSVRDAIRRLLGTVGLPVKEFGSARSNFSQVTVRRDLAAWFST